MGISSTAVAAAQKSERLKFETFIMLVTQCFQLCIKLKDSRKLDNDS